MAAENEPQPVGSKDAALSAGGCLLGIGVFSLSAALYLPASHYGFVNWDDIGNFVENDAFRGLGPNNLAWFFSTYHMGHYQPLNWLGFALDYQFGGLDPGQFHLTQALLHGLAALCVYGLACRILRPSMKGPMKVNTAGHPRRPTAVGGDPQGDADSSAVHPDVIRLAAAVAALLFALHPLRTESVVWLSARSDVLATVFFVLALFAYLHASSTAEDGRDRPAGTQGPPNRWKPLLASGVPFILALLSKEMAVTLPAILLLLDVYPLRRLPVNPLRWLGRRHRPILIEKIPFFVLSAAASVNAFYAAGSVAMPSLAITPLSTRLCQLLVSAAFYPYRTVAPLGLSPLYEYPLGFGPLHPLFLRCAAGLVVAVTTVILFRRRAPAIAAAAAAFTILVLPVSGLLQRGPQFLADRYSYLSCIPFAILAGGVFMHWFQRRPRRTVLVAAAALALLATRTSAQIHIWADSMTLWDYALALDPSSGGAHANLAHALEMQGRDEEAADHYRKALRLEWLLPNVFKGLAGVNERLGRNEDAARACKAWVESYPGNPKAHYALARLAARRGDPRLADTEYRRALELDPDQADAHAGLGRLFVEHGYLREAEPRLRHALALNPRHFEALVWLAKLLSQTQRCDEALSLLSDAMLRVDRREGALLEDQAIEIRRQCQRTADANEENS